LRPGGFERHRAFGIGSWSGVEKYFRTIAVMFDGRKVGVKAHFGKPSARLVVTSNRGQWSWQVVANLRGTGGVDRADLRRATQPNRRKRCAPFSPPVVFRRAC
jgi:hypothetical protein